ncbi:MAG: 6,7-dimethyl-8-ribityllumazine synthase [Bacteroidetes bacterium]|nr:6,7-dimethyl-8-ribityllumazine synthase [Bacteroidota bacterium]MDA1119027.1 6,7-dimethyl-8-ribityllumazine synthase [Bacteroidota bacterium]
MASTQKNLNTYSEKNIGNLSLKRFGIVVSEWNTDVTGLLFEGAIQTLAKYGVSKVNIVKAEVPGSFELSLGSQMMALKDEIDAVICLGCVIQGETRHFEFICQAVAHGITNVGLKYNKPVIFGILTTDNQKQALERAGGRYGNKGEEAAITAIKMLGFNPIALD